MPFPIPFSGAPTGGRVQLDDAGERILRSTGREQLTNGDPYIDPYCCWKQSRICPSPGASSGLWLPAPLIPGTNTIIEGGVCYYFDPADPTTNCPGARHVVPVTSVASCSDPLCGGGGPGPPCYLCTPGTEPAFVDVVLNLNLCPLGCRNNFSGRGSAASDLLLGGFLTKYRCVTPGGCNYEYSGPSGLTLTRYQFADCQGLVETLGNVVIDVDRVGDTFGGFLENAGWYVQVTFDSGEQWFSETILNGPNCSAPFTINKTIRPTDPVCGYGVTVGSGGSVTCTPTNV